MRQGYASRFECDSPGGRVPVATFERRRLHAHQVPCAGWPADVRSGKATTSHVAFRTPTEQSFHRLCSTRGELLQGFLVIRGPGGVLGMFSPRGRRAERGKRLEFVFFTKVQCGTVEVCVVFLDTLTPVFELYVWLWERRQLS
ncbi:hypothetical protein Taro_003950 [Colocasia esculenta]|uniref:Uncharacterized protein n=1 Tax=Colocasia esculenta TaxID=4460 RepID=A0A843TKU8_COLES|nr:hypothetical protein [Colocasia esculenta]